MKFRYDAFDAQGKSVKGVIDAPDAREAGELLRKRGVTPATVEPVTSVEPTARGRRAHPRNIASFMRQLAVLVRTGTPLVDAIQSVERQTPEGAWRDTLSELRRRVEEGASLADAMAQHPRAFDAVVRSLIAAGEAGGRLDAMLDRLAKLTRHRVKMRAQLMGAMVYPSLLVFVSMGVMGAMLGFVMPRFEQLFQTLQAPLPPSTRLLMDLSLLVRGWWWAMLLGLGSVAVGLTLWLRSTPGRAWFDGAIVKLPQVGAIARAFTTARIVRVLGVLIEGKVPLLDALRLTREAAGNRAYARLVEAAENAVVRGEGVSAAWSGQSLIAPSVVEALRSGERTGQIAPVLLSVADAMDEDNEVLLKSVTSIIEPLILVGLGLLVGFMAVSMFLPLFDLTSAGAVGPGAPGAGPGGAP